MTCSDISFRSKGLLNVSLLLHSHAGSCNGNSLQQVSGVVELHETGYAQRNADMISPQLQIYLLHGEEPHPDISKDTQYP